MRVAGALAHRCPGSSHRPGRQPVERGLGRPHARRTSGTDSRAGGAATPPPPRASGHVLPVPLTSRTAALLTGEHTHVMDIRDCYAFPPGRAWPDTSPASPVPAKVVTTTRHARGPAALLPRQPAARPRPAAPRPRPGTAPSPDEDLAAPSTQHPAPSTQHPAPSTQHPAPSTQHPAPSTTLPGPAAPQGPACVSARACRSRAGGVRWTRPTRPEAGDAAAGPSWPSAWHRRRAMLRSRSSPSRAGTGHRGRAPRLPEHSRLRRRAALCRRHTRQARRTSAGPSPSPPPAQRWKTRTRHGTRTAQGSPPLRRGEQRRTEATPGSGHRGNGDRPNDEDKEQRDRPTRRTTGTA